jgi:hypothetical protein
MSRRRTLTLTISYAVDWSVPPSTSVASSHGVVLANAGHSVLLDLDPEQKEAYVT